MTRGRILIVDTDAVIRENLQKMLQIDGYEATEAASCRVAIQSFEASRPDALVVAARLPDGTALDILAHVKRADAGVACVVLARREIETWRVDYNDVRPHSSLDDRTPTEFAAAYQETAA